MRSESLAKRTLPQEGANEAAFQGSSTSVSPEAVIPLSARERQSAFQAIVAECTAFYKLVVVIATSFLGGTLLFIEKIAPHPVRWTLLLLLLGWLLLILSILAVVWVRRMNIEAGRQYLEQDYDKSEAVQSRARRLTDISGVLLGVGMLGVMLFGFCNFWTSTVDHPIQQETPDESTRFADRQPDEFQVHQTQSNGAQADADAGSFSSIPSADTASPEAKVRKP